MTGEMQDQIRKAVVEFGPCSVRDLYDYLRSDIAQKRGLFCKHELSIDGIRDELDKLVENDPSLAKFQCESGIKIRYGLTKFNSVIQSEQRYLHIVGKLRGCFSCGMPVYESEGTTFHLPCHCLRYEKQDKYKLVSYERMKAIVSEDFVFGVVDSINPPRIRFPSMISIRNTQEIMSELWFINRLAQKEGLIPQDRLIPLKVNEKLFQ